MQLKYIKSFLMTPSNSVTLDMQCIMLGGAYNDYPHSYHVLKKLTNPEHEHFNDLIFLFAMPNNLGRPQNIYIFTLLK